MAKRSRPRSRTASKIARIGAATATATALTIGVAIPPVANAAANPLVKVQSDQVKLAAVQDLLPMVAAYVQANLATLGIGNPVSGGHTQGSPGVPSMDLAPGAPDPADIPDLSFGVGTQLYNEFQTLGANLQTFLLNNVNLSFLLQALGLDPETTINNALGTALTSIPLDLSGLPVVGVFLDAAGINTLGKLTALLGLNLADPFNLSGAATPGLNIITAGAPFTLLKFLGIDLGWVPAFPNSVAQEINDTEYLNVGAISLLSTLRNKIPADSAANIALRLTLAGVITGIQATLPSGVSDLDLIDVRIPVVVGFGLGAFAAGMAYPQVVEQLSQQPGGDDYTGSSDPLLGSFTVLPLILLRNPGRANGGLFARFYPLAALAGIDTVTPDAEVTSSGGTPLGDTGLAVGGANLIPIKVDATVEYDPLSDFPAWPNPFALANSGAALLFPTYILRGLNISDALTELLSQAAPQLTDGLTSSPIALNLYLTLPTDALPLMEPVKLPVDVINLLTGWNLNNPVATAFEPALTSLVNLGYTDVVRVQTADGAYYDRTLDQADVITPFGTLPSGIDWTRVPGDVFGQLVAGLQKAIDDGLVSDTAVNNPLATVAALLGLTNSSGALDISKVAALVQNLVGGLSGGNSTMSLMSTNAAAPDSPNTVSNQQLVQTSVPSGAVSGGTPVRDGGLSKLTLGSPTTDASPVMVSNSQLRKQLADAADGLDTASAKARQNVEKSFQNTRKQLDNIAKEGRHQIESAVKDVRKQVDKTVSDVKAGNGPVKQAVKSLQKKSAPTS